MSAFFGIYRKSGAPVTSPELQAMATAMSRRGPDARRFWIKGSVGLGHCMMWTTPEALFESPPLVSPNGTRVLSADVRLDNREQLLDILRPNSPGLRKPIAEIGDHELILAAYEKWGQDCPAHLLGDFAFALWDESQKTVFCARDHFGSKPFHYFLSDGLFVCASEVKGILAMPEVPVRINEPRIADFLVEELEGIDKVCTFYLDIFRMPPATTMLVNREGMTQRRYWRPEPGEPLQLKRQEEYNEAFLDVFTQSIACRLRSHKPPASTLSGGIDSSAIVAIARELRAQQGVEPLHTISAISDTPESCVESQAALAVIQRGNVIAHMIKPSEVHRFFPQAEDFFEGCDDPFSSAYIGVPLAVYCLANEAGINVLLDGIDGDLVTSHGSHYLAYLLRSHQWRTTISEARSHSRNYYRGTISPISLLARNARTAFIPHAMRKLLRGWRSRQRVKDSVSSSIINRAFAQEMKVSERLDRLYARIRAPLKPSLQESQAELLDEGFITVALERYDRQASSQSIETRHPYFDVRLVNFCLSLPWHQRVSNGYSKAILRHIMRGRLPESVRWRVGGWEHLGNRFEPAWSVSGLVFGQRIHFEHSEQLKGYLKPDILERILESQNSRGKKPERLHQVTLVRALASWLTHYGGTKIPAKCGPDVIDFEKIAELIQGR